MCTLVALSVSVVTSKYHSMCHSMLFVELSIFPSAFHRLCLHFPILRICIKIKQISLQFFPCLQINPFLNTSAHFAVSPYLPRVYEHLCHVVMVKSHRMIILYPLQEF